MDSILPLMKKKPCISYGKFNLCDPDADECAVSLAAFLKGSADDGYLLYGHQNDMHMKAGPKNLPFTLSDTADVTGEYAAVTGIDVLSLVGTEYCQWDWPVADRVRCAVDLAMLSVNEGSIISLSAHMPNFQLLYERATGTESSEDRKKGSAGAHAYEGRPAVLSDGSTNFSGYTPDDLRGSVVQDIMPGKKLNRLYREYLDLVCSFLNQLAEKNVAVIWRPFHENTGHWFWWGCRSCSPEEFRNLWQYTWKYMTEEKGVHNVIWAYSPGSESLNKEEFLSRYPGDEYVDLLGFDMYQQCPQREKEFWNDFEKQCILYSSIAEERGKLFANTETGIMRPENKALLWTGNGDLNWYEKVAEICMKYHSCYFLLWANFTSRGAYYSPYVTKRTVEGGRIVELEGHEMLNAFVTLYNMEKVVFSRGVKSCR